MGNDLDPNNRALPSARATHEPSPDGLGHSVGVPNAAPCKHETQIKSCGMKVCFDCGAPLNAKSRHIAAMRGAA